MPSHVDITHLQWPQTGWGYLPPTETLFSILKGALAASQPENILEIGFNAGHSTTYLLELGQCNITTIGPSPVGGMEDVMADKYGDRFTFLWGRSEDVEIPQIEYQLAFVDGMHTFEHALHDIKLCQWLQIPYILVDNVDQPAVESAVAACDIELMCIGAYPCTFKGKTKVNGLNLYHNVPRNDLQKPVRQRNR